MSDDQKQEVQPDTTPIAHTEDSIKRVVKKKPVKTAKDVKSAKNKYLSTEAEADSDASSDEPEDLSDVGSLAGFVVDEDESLGISGSENEEMEDGSMHRMLESQLDEMSDAGVAASSVSDLARARPKGKSLHQFKLSMDEKDNTSSTKAKTKMQQMRDAVAEAKGKTSRRARLVVGSDSEETREESLQREKARQIVAEMNNESDASMHQSAQCDEPVALSAAQSPKQVKPASKPAAKPAAKRKPSAKPSAKTTSNAALLSTVAQQFEASQTKKKQAAKPRKSRAKPRPALAQLESNSLWFRPSGSATGSPAKKKRKTSSNKASPAAPAVPVAAQEVVEGVSDSDSDREADPQEASGKFAAEGAHVRLGRVVFELVHRGEPAAVKPSAKDPSKLEYNPSLLSHKNYCTIKGQDGELKMVVMSHELGAYELNKTALARAIEKKTNEDAARFAHAVKCDNRVKMSDGREKLFIPPCLLTTKVVAQKVLRQQIKESCLPHSFEVLQRSNIENMFAKVLSLELEEKQYTIAKLEKRFIAWGTKAEEWKQAERDNAVRFEAEKTISKQRFEDVMRFFAVSSKPCQDVLMRYAIGRSKKEQLEASQNEAIAESGDAPQDEAVANDE